MSEMQKILKILMDQNGDDAYSLEEKSGVPQPTTQRFLSGKHGDPRSPTVKKWAAAYGITESQLRGDQPIDGIADGSDKSHEYDPSNRKVQQTPHDYGHLNYIKKYDETGGSMGRGFILSDQPGQITNLVVTDEWITKNVPSNSGKKNLSVITGFGDSMKGLFNPGDPLLVDLGVTTCDHEGVYFFRVGNEGYVKRLQRIPKVGIRVISKNPDYETWTITEDMDFEVIAKVLKVWNSENF